MSSACRSLLALLLLIAAPAGARELRVCADPNDLPFSNEAEEGFENRIVRILADELHAEVRYTWWAQRRGFIRSTLAALKCDLVAGVPSNMEMLRTSAPYYRSTYVFVTRAADRLAIASFDDPQLRTLMIGVPLVGDDGANPPPAHALTRRGIVANVRGYPVYGDYADPAPSRAMFDALAAGEIDVAVAWGPIAGYFASRVAQPLSLAPVSPQIDGPMLPMVFDISMGMRKTDEGLRADIDAALAARRAEIDTVLADFGVPRLDGTAP